MYKRLAIESKVIAFAIDLTGNAAGRNWPAICTRRQPLAIVNWQASIKLPECAVPIFKPEGHYTYTAHTRRLNDPAAFIVYVRIDVCT
jgi:hypothetical protein